jgi:glycosyltransferase involved in cell wall biosynthesis
MTPPLLTVIIPTLADNKRSRSLLRAIASVVDQKEVPVEVLVVVNGQRFDPELVNLLESRSELRVVKLAQPSLSNAIHQGCAAITTPYFSFLDDDDQYLLGSIQKRLLKLQDNPDCLMVASSGFRETEGHRTVSAFNLLSALKNPYHELAVNNWMTSCGAIFRSSLVSSDTFKNIPPHHEWTYLAYKIVALGPFCIVDEPCYIIHDTPGSLSKSAAYSEAPANVLREVLKIDLPATARQSVMIRLAKAEHNLASNAISNGLRAKAIRHHVNSLLLPGGLKYILFSRHLMKFKISRRNDLP